MYSIILGNCKYVTICSVFVFFEIKMENPKKKTIFLSNKEFFFVELGKNILFGIRNGAKFQPQNQVIECPVNIPFHCSTVCSCSSTAWL